MKKSFNFFNIECFSAKSNPPRANCEQGYKPRVQEGNSSTDLCLSTMLHNPGSDMLSVTNLTSSQLESDPLLFYAHTLKFFVWGGTFNFRHISDAGGAFYKIPK